MVKGTHHGTVKDGAETSRRATAPRRQQPLHGVGKRWCQSASLTRQSPSALARFLAKKGKHVRKEHVRREAGLPRARKCNKLGTVVLTLKELRHITNNFSDDQLIGEGGFGKVYKVVLRNGDTIAVKRFASTIAGLRDYDNEAQHLMRLEHPNIVQLVGYCSGKDIKLVRHNGTFVLAEQLERLLCLEYMPKGSLGDHLSDKTSRLEWNTRYQIIEGICNGLRYLHEEWEATPIIHMDLKPANILLDDNMVPKIADFGLSRLFGEEQTRTYTTRRNGTLGYMPPEYLDKGVITKKFDIFSLGVIIIEIITGHKDYPTAETETASQQYIDLVLNSWRHRLTKVQGDTSQDIDYQQIKKCIQIAPLCVKSDRVKRPTINQIIEMLERSDEAYQNEREEEAQWWFHSWRSTVLQDLFPEVQPDADSRTSIQKSMEELRSRLYSWESMNSIYFRYFELPDSKCVSTVRFIGLAGEGRKLDWAGWKEKSMKGMRAVADPSPQPPEQQQQRYVALKKTLELDADRNGNKWRAHEYTALLPSDDGSDMFVPAEISLRVEFREEEPEPSSPPLSLSSKRSRSCASKDDPKKSLVWEHMTKVHVKVATTTTDGAQRMNPSYYKVRFVICHHCDKVFNADPARYGTSHLRRHLDRCRYNCTLSQSH